MAIQIVIVVEADERSRSDYIYIRSVLEKWFNLHMLSNVKYSAVFMGGKGNYNKKKIVNEINTHVKRFNALGETHVVYCFDTDKYDSDPYDRKLLSDEEKYCKDNDYDFVWFCHDIEEVFLGKSVAKSEKTDKARRYSANNGIDNIDKENLKAKTMTKGKSNLLCVLNKILFIQECE